MYSFQLNTQIHYGAKSREKIFEISKSENWRNIGLVIDHNIVDVPVVQKFVQELKSVVETLVVGAVTVSEPTYDYLEEIRRQFDDPGLQVLIGIGGGSALDVAKAVAVLVKNRKPALEYRGFDKMTEPVLPIVALPTTAGTGSEITPNASFVDTAEQRKLGINGNAIRPLHAVLDPDLIVSCPRRASISAGVDAIVHAHDSYISNGHTPYSRVFSLEGFRRVISNLSSSIREPENQELRGEVLYGAMFAAAGMIHSGGGATAVLSYPLGVMYKVSHGIAGGVFLPYVMQFNINNGYFGYADLYMSLKDADTSLSREQMSVALLDRLKKLWAELEIPETIGQFGYSTNDREEFVRQAMMMKGGLDGNPITFHEQEIENCLDKLQG